VRDHDHRPQPGELTQAVARILRAERAGRDWTGDKTARRLGVSPSVLSRTEQGKYAITLDRLHALCTVLGITPADVLRRAQDELDQLPNVPRIEAPQRTADGATSGKQTGDWQHGASAYSASLCRCEVCTAAGTARKARDLAARLAARELVDGVLVAPGLRQHGTSNGYRNWGCRCLACFEANQRDMRRYRERRKAAAAEEA
jgi:transcriptional regulator with XRE-family HTH domain